ncbi:MAG TPA: hypothetical protein VF401_03685 [Candidatus Saccharimonadales bacterium]
MITNLLNFTQFFGAASAGDTCPLSHGGFLGFPTWFQYLDGEYIHSDPSNSSSSLVCDQVPHIGGINDIWLIVAAVIGILLRIVAIAAIGAVIYGGISYITSEGEPDKTSRAKGTVVNALVGLAISIMAAAIISFIAGSIS